MLGRVPLVPYKVITWLGVPDLVSYFLAGVPPYHLITWLSGPLIPYCLAKLYSMRAPSQAVRYEGTPSQDIPILYARGPRDKLYTVRRGRPSQAVKYEETTILRARLYNIIMYEGEPEPS